MQETTGEVGDSLGQANPTGSKAKQGRVPIGDRVLLVPSEPRVGCIEMRGNVRPR